MESAWYILGTAAGVAGILTLWRYLQLKLDMRSMEMQHRILQDSITQQKEIMAKVLDAAFAVQELPSQQPPAPDYSKENEEIANAIGNLGADNVSVTGI